MGHLLHRLVKGLESLGLVLGKDGVFLSELPHPPDIRVQGNRLMIRMGHSLRHSAKEVYKTQVSFQKKTWRIRAFQKLVTRPFGKPFHQEIPLPDGTQIPPGNEIEVLWTDPDGAVHPIDITVE